MHQIICRLGLPPDPIGRAYNAPSERREEEERDRAEEGTGGRGKGERGREREGPGRAREGREGEVREGEGRAPATLWHGAPNVLIRPWDLPSFQRIMFSESCLAASVSTSASSVAT